MVRLAGSLASGGGVDIMAALLLLRAEANLTGDRIRDLPYRKEGG